MAQLVHRSHRLIGSEFGTQCIGCDSPVYAWEISQKCSGAHYAGRIQALEAEITTLQETKKRLLDAVDELTKGVVQ